MPLGEVTFTDFLNNHWGTITVLLTGFGAALSAATAWLARTVWVRIDEYWQKRDKREQTTSTKGDMLIDTLAAHAPAQTDLLNKLADTQTAIAMDIQEGRKRDSDVLREIVHTKDAAAELSYGLEEMASDDPQIKERVERYMKRAREKLGVAPKPKPTEGQE